MNCWWLDFLKILISSKFLDPFLISLILRFSSIPYSHWYQDIPTSGNSSQGVSMPLHWENYSLISISLHFLDHTNNQCLLNCIHWILMFLYIHTNIYSNPSILKSISLNPPKILQCWYSRNKTIPLYPILPFMPIFQISN